MILIADSGSTKTDWRLILYNKRILSFRSAGLNPYHLSSEGITEELNKLNISSTGISKIFFYGSGIAGDEMKLLLRSLLSKRFGHDGDIFVEDDQLAAARALFKERKGIACILGTGSSSCLYMNGKIHDKVPALGYILGDEGSGTDIGKKFINALLKRKFPQDLSEDILRNEDLSIEGILENVYKNPLPNRYLATFAEMAGKYIYHDSVSSLIEEAFGDFIVKNISKYTDFKNLEIGFIGSVAYHFKDILGQAMEKYDLRTGPVLLAPIEELAAFHLS